jgi:cobalt/nickel transport system permease protein
MRRLDPRMLVICTVATVTAVTLTPPGRWERLGAEAALVLGGMVAARVSWRRLLSRLALLAPFVLMAALSLPFMAASSAHRAVAPMVLVATALAKAVIGMGALTALTSLLPIHELLAAMQALGLPAILTTLTAFLLRYLGVLEDEASRMMRARDARGTPAGRRRGQPLAARAAVAGHLVGSLFLRSYERAGRIARAMQSRGFDGTLLRVERRPVPAASWCAGTLFLLMLVALAYV